MILSGTWSSSSEPEISMWSGNECNMGDHLGARRERRGQGRLSTGNRDWRGLMRIYRGISPFCLVIRYYGWRYEYIYIYIYTHIFDSRIKLLNKWIMCPLHTSLIFARLHCTALCEMETKHKPNAVRPYLYMIYQFAWYRKIYDEGHNEREYWKTEND